MDETDILSETQVYKGENNSPGGGPGRTKLFEYLLVFACVMASSFAVYPSSQNEADQKVDFLLQIRPIFQTYCYSCHNANKASGRLRLDDKKAAMKGSSSGAVIVPGEGKTSRLMQRILGERGLARMPMGGPALTDKQIAHIRAWIDQGAVWPDELPLIPQIQPQKHWAYIKPVRHAEPQVKGQLWARNPIDRFILARLESEGLKPSPEASKETLLRRVSLDLTGLPPTIQELDEFEADSEPLAYEKAVDRLLASPQYGERWARPWLDLARYADTNGYEKDKRRVMWKYRDWVINAFNSDMPFDQFTIEQIAGDMLPNATIDQKIASGFHRNTLLNQEGGVDPEEARWETIIDRVNTTAAVWLGSTFACAQCHDHKYDPISQRDYYRFFAFFDNVEYNIETNSGEQWVEEPTLQLPTPGQAARRDEIQKEISLLESRIKSGTPELSSEQSRWESEVAAAPARWVTIEPIEFSSSGGAELQRLPDNSLLARGAGQPEDTYTIRARVALSGITALRIEALPDPSLPRGGPGRDPYGNFSLQGIEVEVCSTLEPSNKTTLVVAGVRSDEGKDEDLLKKAWSIDATKDKVRLPRQAVFTAKAPFGYPGGTLIELRLRHKGRQGQSIGRLRLSITTSARPESIVNVSAALRPVLMTASVNRTDEQQVGLAKYFLTVAPSLRPARQRLRELSSSLADLRITTAEVMAERGSFERPSTYLRIRGGYTTRGEKVFAATPAFLHPMPETEMPNRLGLARWLADQENPLIARVTVNRFWEQFFGRGLVETSEDFGAQGAKPSHPELLDWLATEFVRNKWSVKSLHRLIVTSSTYRQSSGVSRKLLERDPYNRLLGRGPRFRMEAEMVRDAMLAASGLLSRKIGGPSVFPLQPEGIWNTPYNDDRWEMSAGEDRYRRSLYTFVRRTSPNPAMTAFDAPSREVCTLRRPRTNTPLQALTTLNDEAFFETARALAKRIINEGPADPRSRAARAFRITTSRRPQEAELKRVLALYETEIIRFTKDVKAAKALLHDYATALDDSHSVEMAAWTMVANVLLNLDESLTKE
jgi:mono/diheme cytochrome c family protein